MKERFGQIIQLKPEYVDEYKKYHSNVWSEVNEMIKKCGIQNYSIYLKNNILFSYFEYCGDDYEADMQKMQNDPITQKWWSIVKPFQEPLKNREDGEWWSDMEEVYHLD